ncbi:DUF3551 domain-containing protein [Terricaulis silvestris]|uniref:DUF3551 domain-containing protein n=1 Tax=Terricaulis silvestris TaxID=2686094 RepID=A0A6I6MIG4_9CAUL|nr:hypothetical protein DSM104635_01718 [Terricaulis silvestris]
MRCILLAMALATIGVAAFASNAVAQSGSAPFCTVDNTGTQFNCYYYSMDACRQAAGPSGACVVNQQGQSRNRFDFISPGSSVGIYDDMRRAREATTPPAPATSGLSARQRRWLEMCRDMEQSYFDDLESFRSRFNPPMTAEEYAYASSQFRGRGEYCRALAQ